MDHTTVEGHLSMQDITGQAANFMRGAVVRLRRTRETDLTALVRWWNDPELAVLQRHSVLPQAEDSVEDMFRQWSQNSSGQAFGYSIETREEHPLGGQTLVGHITLWGIDSVVRAGTMSIMIGPEFMGHGCGSDAIAVILRVAFEELHLNKVELSVYEFNARAVHTYEKAGFRREGTRRAAVFHRGRYWSQYNYGLLWDEYRQ